MNKIDELKKLKTLLDEGAISEDEFNSLKLQILNVKEDYKPNEKNKKCQESQSSEKYSQKDAINMLDKMDLFVAPQNLIYFIEKNDINKVNLLLNAGLNPNEPFYNDKVKCNFFALHQAAIFGTTEIIDKLIEFKADVNIKDAKGRSPIFSAIKKGKLENVIALIKNGADVNFKSKSKINPLYYATKREKNEIIDILKKEGAKEMTKEEIKAHQLTKLPTYIIIGVVIIGFFWLFGGNIFTPSSKCENNRYEYQEGYAAGKLTRTMGGSGSCSDYMSSYNNETGRNKYTTDCFCKGFKDGVNGDPAKY